MKDSDEMDDQMNCGLSVAERDLLQTRLRALGDTVPPRAVWQRIETQARAEGLFRRRLGEGAKWLAGAAIAATVALAVLNIQLTTHILEEGSEEFSATPPVSAATDVATPADLSALMVQSQRIERDLRALPVAPSLMRASTAATIAELEDRIAAIDYVLNHPQAQMTPEQAEIYWRERVRLMNSLFSLRRAQAQKSAF